MNSPMYDLELSIMEHGGNIYLDMKSDIKVGHKKNLKDILNKLVRACELSAGFN